MNKFDFLFDFPVTLLISIHRLCVACLNYQLCIDAIVRIVFIRYHTFLQAQCTVQVRGLSNNTSI